MVGVVVLEGPMGAQARMGGNGKGLDGAYLVKVGDRLTTLTIWKYCMKVNLWSALILWK